MGLCVGYYFLFEVLSFFALDVFLYPSAGQQKSTNIDILFGLIRDLSDLAVIFTLVILLSQHIIQFIEENRLYVLQFLFCPCIRSQEQRDLLERNNQRDRIINSNRRYLRQLGIYWHRYPREASSSFNAVRTLEDDWQILHFELVQFGIDSLEHAVFEMSDLTHYRGSNIHSLFRRPIYELDLRKIARDNQLAAL